MKYIKTFERRIGEPQYINGSYKTFDLYDLQKDCIKYEINIFYLIREMVLNKKITFQCSGCFDEHKKYIIQNSHNVIGKCTDIDYENTNYLDSDIIVKIENIWHTILIRYLKNERKQKVRIFNYTEGKLMKQLNAFKAGDKYNL